MANEHGITIPVYLDEKTFKRFASFDMLRLRKRWVRPAMFALLLVIFGVIALWSHKPQSGLIAAVLFVVGLGLPLVYFGFFFSQVNMQALERKLGNGRKVYTVHLDVSGITVVNNQKNEEPLTVGWQKIHQAFRVTGCTYLYVNPERAFLLPDGQADTSDEEVWQYLVNRMGKEKCKNNRRK